MFIIIQIVYPLIAVPVDICVSQHHYYYQEVYYSNKPIKTKHHPVKIVINNLSQDKSVSQKIKSQKTKIKIKKIAPKQAKELA